jgi:PKD repeat protein
MHRARLALPLLTLASLLVGLLAVPAGVQGTPLSRSPVETVVVRFYFESREHLDAVAGELDIWEVHPQKGYAVAAVTPAQYSRLGNMGYRPEIDAQQTAGYGIQAPLDPRFYYFDNYYTNPNGFYMVDLMQSINAAYPNLTELFDIGYAWLAGQPGEHDRNIWVLRITNEDPAYGAIEDKPAFYLFSGIHAREVAIPELVIRYIKYLTEGYNGEGGYGVDADATWLVDHNVIYVLVSQNPDGHWKNEENTSNNRRKNMNSSNGSCSASTLGVDLNRNSSFFWGCCGGSSGDECYSTYRGPSAASEPETQAFQAHFASVMQDQNGPNGENELPPAAPITTTGIFISLHSYSDLVLWPYGFAAGTAPNDAQLETIGRKFGLYTDYEPSGDIYTVDGATDDWTYGMFGIASFTFEVGPGGIGMCNGFFPDFECIDGAAGWPENFWAENKPAFIYAHKIARTPYVTTYGPDAESLAVVPTIAISGTTVQLNATIADHRYGGDPLPPIHGAEYFIGAPGEDGAGTPMAPADGSWGDLSEVVTATLDTTGLSLGQHYALVHGQNNSGDWGPFTAVFFYVVEPGALPVIEGYVRDAGTLAPLEATVYAGPFTAFGDAATGYYSMTVLSDTYDVSAVAAGYAISTVQGIVAPEYATIQQDFLLYPYCDLFADNVESGNVGWTATGDWAITTEASHSPGNSWTDSPGGNYSNNRNTSLRSPAFDLSGYTGTTLGFWHIYDTEPGYDYAYVEYSTNGGGSWATPASYAGYDHTTWTWVELELPELDNEPNVQIRFRLQSDYGLTADGWHIDDIVISAGGPGCLTIPPTAAFTSSSPVELGHTMVFTDLSVGSLPMSYSWDFGDSLGITEVRNPSYTYLTTGTFTVTLAVTNSFGSDRVNHSVVVYEPAPKYYVYLPLVWQTD